MTAHCDTPSQDKLDAVTSTLVRFGSGGVHQGKSLVGTAALGGDADQAVMLTKWMWGNPPTLMKV
ncbi:hypothetical protein O7626_38305 [Micromonospora sp. WMMD1102]|uniref:hypothetical protein n=1 Tax=Micromonosporaceae TaxID=28056 RepID=UPI00241537A2|nr:hypothetical protein [Micromonospora sp. WMMD1102]MDG4791680.1 hypothetical protein [Micromonospora sp. WMMD1102]